MAFAASLGGWKGEGSALSGADLISLTLTPSLSSRPETCGYWNSTPIDPTIDVWLATTRSPATATM